MRGIVFHYDERHCMPDTPALNSEHPPNPGSKKHNVPHFRANGDNATCAQLKENRFHGQFVTDN
jgi:hypothetical protein